VFVHSGLKSNVFVVSSLIDMYAKCGSIEDAWKVFNETPIHNVVCWSAMIVGYVRCGQGQKALELSQQMHQDGVEPDSMTFVGILNACANLSSCKLPAAARLLLLMYMQPRPLETKLSYGKP
jgi:pentatricopeptide repeat protein